LRRRPEDLTCHHTHPRERSLPVALRCSFAVCLGSYSSIALVLFIWCLLATVSENCFTQSKRITLHHSYAALETSSPPSLSELAVQGADPRYLFSFFRYSLILRQRQRPQLCQCRTLSLQAVRTPPTASQTNQPRVETRAAQSLAPCGCNRGSEGKLHATIRPAAYCHQHITNFSSAPPLDPKFRTIPPHSKAKYSDHTTTSSTAQGRVVDLCHYLSRFPLGAWCCHLRSRNGRELSATHGRPWPNDAPAATTTTTTAAKSEWPCCDPNPIDNL